MKKAARDKHDSLLVESSMLKNNRDKHDSLLVESSMLQK